MADLTTHIADSLTSVDAAQWNALDHGASPFTEYGFLAALERSGSVGPEAGWEPAYVLVSDSDRLVGAVAAYFKVHSYGEYIFDWAWARASERAGLAYYPKLVVAVPMTPATGRRLLVARDVARDAVVDRLVAGVRTVADTRGCKSVHWLFTGADEQAELAARGFLARQSFQYHWHNAGYADFAGFLARMTSRRRKQLRKERATVAASGLVLDWVPGSALTADDVATIDRYYRNTTWNHHGHDYLQPGFFAEVVKAQPERIEWARVRRGDDTVAGALFFFTEAGRYGRYWGCDEEIPCLHFEVAYYAAIERCIAQGTPLFEAGAQGEHKLIRGFTPSPTYSSHEIRHPGFAAAIAQFLRDEAAAVAAQMQHLATYLPYRTEV